MHELALCQALIEEVEAVARRHRAGGVAGVRLLVGPMSGVEPALLESAFPLAVAGTVVEGAVLAIERSLVHVTCERCGARSEALPNRLLCAACGDWHTRVVSGDELTLASVELILAQDPAAEAATHV